MRIEGKSIYLRTVETSDADFVYAMRKNRYKTKYLSAVSGTADAQKTWIINYKTRENQGTEYYFIIESKKHEKLGLVRMYDFNNDSFSWGSWLIKEDAPTFTAIESALQIYEFAFYQLGFTQSHFEVQKGNTKIISFHQRFGAKIVNENELEYFFTLTKEEYEVTKKKYKRYL